MRRGGECERLVWKGLGQVAEQRSNGEVLVDDDHRLGERSVVVRRRTATEQEIRIADRRQRVSELVGQVTGRDATKDLLVALRQPRIARAPLASELLAQALAGRWHPAIVPRLQAHPHPRGPAAGLLRQVTSAITSLRSTSLRPASTG